MDQASWVFFGSGPFAHRLIDFFEEIGFLPHKIVTSPPSRKGRGLRMTRSKIAISAESLGLRVNEPENPNSPEFVNDLKSFNPDFIVVSDYGKILRRELLEIPRELPLNIHPSLLPRYRGAAPIERAIMNGEKALGITIFQMDEGIDTGPILLQKEIPIKEEETKGEILPRLAREGALLLKGAMEKFLGGEIVPRPQPSLGASYAKKIAKEELWLNFERPVAEVVNHIRALSPRPGARTLVGGMLLKILRARAGQGKAKPGEILPNRKALLIGCSSGILEVLELIPEGRRPMSGEEFLAGHPGLWGENKRSS